MFDGLASQEVMVLINDHDPKPLFYQFQMLYTKETEGGIQMNQGAHFCGSMMFGSADRVTLCEPLAKLKREHGPLREQMDAIAREAAEIGTDQDKNDWRQQLAKLKKRTEHFIGELDPHSEREEETLFPLLAKYIGREVGPIAVMEYEHELAKHHLSTFMEAMDQEKGAVDATRAKEIASYLLQAHSVLTDHFMKEENVLFPMAENMLNAEEKEELDRAFGLS
jgi:hemerythrin-like domain-containing protein